MNKKQIITILQQAKPDHMRWIIEGHKLLNGLPQNQVLAPAGNNECLFGKWYENEGYKLKNVYELQDLESLHTDIHNIYTAIYYITFDRRKKARTTVISGYGEIPVNEKKFRQKKLKQLEKKSVQFVRSLDKIEKKVNSMTLEDFKSPWLS